MRKRKVDAENNSEDQLSECIEEKRERRGGDFNLFSSSRNIFAFCLAFRAVNSLLVQTYFNPDEHWQALEVAHKIVFGYGHLTWEWNEGIRSYLHPIVFAVFYKILAIAHLDTPWVMVKGPRLLQSVFCAVGDLYLYKLSHTLFGQRVARWAIFSQLANWFMLFCFTRTLSSSLEAVFTVMGLYYFPSMRRSSHEQVSRKRGLIIAALACAIRPTSAITWVYVGLIELLSARDKPRFVFAEVIPIGVTVLGASTLLDRLMYGSWVLAPLNFFKFNFMASGGDYYGTHKWHWYISQGLPAMLFSFLPFSACGVFSSGHWRLSGLILWTLLTYSFLGHKEFRFVFPVLPLALLSAGYVLAALAQSFGRDESFQKVPLKSWKNLLVPSRRGAVIFLLATNIPMALYMTLVHQRGAEDVMRFLSKEASEGRVESVLFLMPCHSTPFYSALHRDVPMRFLDCTPRKGEGRKGCESERFLADPVGFSREHSEKWKRPSHIVMFDVEERQLKGFLSSHSFKEVSRFFYAHFKVDRDRLASVVVYVPPSIKSN